MRTGSFVLMAALAAAASTPVAGQIADRTGQNRGRNAVVVRPDEARRQDVPGRASGGSVIPEVAADRARWDQSCTEYRRSRRDGRHGWFDEDGRYDCDYGNPRYDDRYGRDVRYDRVDGYDRNRRPVGVTVRASLVREHVALINGLDREHDRWHRAHGWNPRNRGWSKAHAALHRKLDREHDRWHRRVGVPFTLWPDGIRHNDVAGRGRGVVIR